MLCPPSTGNSTPVMKPASSVARRSAAATSCGRAGRAGWLRQLGHVLRACSACRRVAAQAGVARRRRDHVDADAIAAEFDRERSGQHAGRALGGAVPGEPRSRSSADGRSGVQDHAAAAHAHQRHEGVHQVKQRLDVDLVQLVEVPLVERQRGRADPGGHGIRAGAVQIGHRDHRVCSLANRRAVAAPKPLAAPVTIATLSVSRMRLDSEKDEI